MLLQDSLSGYWRHSSPCVLEVVHTHLFQMLHEWKSQATSYYSICLQHALFCFSRRRGSGIALLLCRLSSGFNPIPRFRQSLSSIMKEKGSPCVQPFRGCDMYSACLLVRAGLAGQILAWLFSRALRVGRGIRFSPVLTLDLMTSFGNKPLQEPWKIDL